MLKSLLNLATEGVMDFHFTFLVLIQVLDVFFSLRCETLSLEDLSGGCVHSRLYYSCILRTILSSMLYTCVGSGMPHPSLEVQLCLLVKSRCQTMASSKLAIITAIDFFLLGVADNPSATRVLSKSMQSVREVRRALLAVR